jgi:hypothetical protein
VVTFQYDLAANATPSTAPTLIAPPTTQSFTFGTGATVTWFVVVLKGATAAGNFDLLKLDVDYDDV